MNQAIDSTPAFAFRARRNFLGACGALFVLPVAAQFRVDISGVGETRLPVAVARFREGQNLPQSVAAIVRADLERSGLIRPVDSPAVLDETARPVWAEWRGQGVDALLTGSVNRLADGRFDVRYRLWDVVKGVDIGSLGLTVAAADLRVAAHRVADAVYERLTGEKGVFSTRIAYVMRSGTRYVLRVTDADGEGGQVALASPEAIISPAWSPSGLELAYVSFESQKAVVWAQDIASGKRRQLANFRGSNSAPAWSPDGQLLAMTLSREGGSQLYLMDRDGAGVRRLTRSDAIDTEPVFAPDGRSVFFVSDRGGGPQIYRVGLDGVNPERVSFSGSYNISPSISPDGRNMAYVTRQNGAFKLMVMDLASGSVQSLTDTSDDESPSFAPNGRLIIYATREQGREVLMTTTLDGRIKARLLSSGADVREPVWGPFGR